MYKNIWYDHTDNKIYEREIGSQKYKEENWKMWCYVPDPKGVYLDCFGNKMSRQLIRGENPSYAINRLRKKHHYKLAESDLRPAVKYLHAKYDDVEISQEEWKDYRIAMYDIETQTSRPRDIHEKIDIRINGIVENMSAWDFERKYPKEVMKAEVPDGPEGKWVKYSEKYIESCFPNPLEARFPINLITVWSSVDKKTHTWGLNAYTGDHEIEYHGFFNEREMLCDFVDWFSKQEFDVLSGWNSEKFDDPYILERIRKVCGLEVVKRMSPLKKEYVRREVSSKSSSNKKFSERADSSREEYHYSIPGLFLIDYLALYKFIGFVKNSPSWKLNYIGKKEIGEGKVDLDGGIESYLHDWNTFVEYNVQDVVLLTKIEDKKRLWPTSISYAYEAMILLDQIFSMTTAHDGYIIKKLHREGRVYSDAEPSNMREDWWLNSGLWRRELAGGVIEYQNCTEEKGDHFDEFEVKAGYCFSTPGRYQHCMSADITSSYPNHIIMYNISPETVVRNPKREDIDSGKVIASEINGVGFLNTQNAILPSVVEKIFTERIQFKKAMQKAEQENNLVEADRFRTLQLCRKKLINSLYGACLYPRFHLFNIDCARSITRCARVTIRMLKNETDRYYRSSEMLEDCKKYFPTVRIDGKWMKRSEKIETDSGLMTVEDFLQKRDAVTINGSFPNVYINPLNTPITPMKATEVEKIFNLVAYGICHEYREGDPLEILVDSESVSLKVKTRDGYPEAVDSAGKVWSRQEIMKRGKVKLEESDCEKLPDEYIKIDEINLIERPLKWENRESVVIQVDTDSNYYCFNEHKIYLFPYMGDMEWFYCMESMMEDFWERILENRAKRAHMVNKIVFTRENMFSNFISYGKKMYLGSIVDKDGQSFGYDCPNTEHLKIQGLVLKKTEFPIFCQEYAIKITANVLFGQDKENTFREIREAYQMYKKCTPDEICAFRTVGDLSKYFKIVPDNLEYPSGCYSSIKIAGNFNYINEKERLGLNPLVRGTKAKYLFLLPNNRYRIDVLGFDIWPKRFDEIFEIDYKMCFEKFFMSVFNSLFLVMGWSTSKKNILDFTTNKKRDAFFKCQAK